MDKINFIMLCHFGLEKILKNEVRRLGLEVIGVTDGEIKALGNLTDIPRLNFNLRTAERVMIELGSFEALSFDDLFEKVKMLPIEKYVPVDGAFPITKANKDKNSKLYSTSDIQSITKKAMVNRLKDFYNTDNLPEDNGRYPFRVKMYKNIASIRLDTTGDSLHKRGYRIKAGLAPIEETLAASLIKLTGFADKLKEGRLDDKKNDVLIDAFCGSGTIPIEAAMIAANIPVSIDRAFVSETWRHLIDKKCWDDAKEEAKNKIDVDRINDKEIKIFGFDIDPMMIKIAKENAIRAGVDKMIHFETLPVDKLATCKEILPMKKYKEKFIVSNPPYGERLEDKEKIIPIYRDIKKSYDNMRDYELHIITSFEEAEKYIGKATKNRKIYNGMIKTYFYSYIN